MERDFLELRREKSAADRIGAGFIKVFIGGRAADERSTAAIKKKEVDGTKNKRRTTLHAPKRLTNIQQNGPPIAPPPPHL